MSLIIFSPIYIGFRISMWTLLFVSSLFVTVFAAKKCNKNLLKWQWVGASQFRQFQFYVLILLLPDLILLSYAIARNSQSTQSGKLEIIYTFYAIFSSLPLPNFCFINLQTSCGIGVRSRTIPRYITIQYVALQVLILFSNICERFYLGRYFFDEETSQETDASQFGKDIVMFTFVVKIVFLFVIWYQVGYNTYQETKKHQAWWGIVYDFLNKQNNSSTQLAPSESCASPQKQEKILDVQSSNQEDQRILQNVVTSAPENSPFLYLSKQYQYSFYLFVFSLSFMIAMLMIINGINNSQNFVHWYRNFMYWIFTVRMLVLFRPKSDAEYVYYSDKIQDFFVELYQIGQTNQIRQEQSMYEMISQN
eukprot:TRINITY_DN176_c2_g1_i2.p1 TRINITY_DN176_c2_g1~~TRINITY_DN176_c2_g1_i2.p1  ORF type:complete len:364 (-),score=2.60 TRINITY_DN176_c2_g1_i2:702-1793(-)